MSESNDAAEGCHGDDDISREVHDALDRFIKELDSDSNPRIENFWIAKTPEAKRESLQFMLRAKFRYMLSKGLMNKSSFDLCLKRFSDYQDLVTEEWKRITADWDRPLPVVPNHYELQDELGRGGMGVVYRAWDKRLKRVVALKMILSGSSADEGNLKRLQKEAEAVAQLEKHPHIVKIHDVMIHDVEEHDGEPFISLEFVEGGGLDKKISGKPQKPDWAAGLVEKLALAVHFAHEQKIVHRDLKPSNVLLTGKGEPKIADFGLAKRLEDDASQTASGSIMGTPPYMAPEQADDKQITIGPQTDVYGLGAILYCLLTGRPPFQSFGVWDTVKQVLEQEPIPPSQLVSGLDRDLETITLKCLQKAPERRYHTAEELAEELRRYQEDKPILARPVGEVERVWRWCKRKPAIAGVWAMTLALLLTVGLFGWAEFENKQLLTQQAFDSTLLLMQVDPKKARGQLDELRSLPLQRREAAIDKHLNEPNLNEGDKARLRLGLLPDDENQVEKIVDYVFSADGVMELQSKRDELDLFCGELAKMPRQTVLGKAKKLVSDPCENARKRAHAAVILLRLSKPGSELECVWKLFDEDPEDRTVASWVINWAGNLGAKYSPILIKQFENEKNEERKRHLLLALGGAKWGNTSCPNALTLTPAFLKLVDECHETCRDQGLKSAAAWLLNQKPASGFSYPSERFVELPPKSFKGPWQLGSPCDEAGRDKWEPRWSYPGLGHRFEISVREITKRQFRSILCYPEAKSIPGVPLELDADHPVPGSWFEAAEYCNLLSKRKGIPEDQWCFEPNEEGEYRSGMKVKAGFMNLRGFRLPTEVEWEFACRAGSLTSRCYGQPEELLPYYAHTKLNEEIHRLVTWPVGQLRPNKWGLFDMHGNVFEWCIDEWPKKEKDPFSWRTRMLSQKIQGGYEVERETVVTMRGGAAGYPKYTLRSAYRTPAPADFDFSLHGFRVVRTVFPEVGDKQGETKSNDR